MVCCHTRGGKKSEYKPKLGVQKKSHPEGSRITFRLSWLLCKPDTLSAVVQ